MTKKRCTDCKHTKGIGYDFWCGEGHTEYEVFGAETNCPYFEYHDWSKGTPSKTKKRFTQKDEDDWEILDRNKHFAFAHSGYQAEKIIQELNELVETNRELYKENKQLKMGINSLKLLVQNWEALDEEKDEQLDKQNQKLKKLVKENTQLKQLINDKEVEWLRNNTVWEQMPTNKRTVTKTTFGDENE